MSFLLDTHVRIWTQEKPDAIGSSARALLETTADDLCVSAVSSLEIARLGSGGVLTLQGTVDRRVRAALNSIEARSIDVDHRVAIEASKLPGRFHKDPADRLLVATGSLANKRSWADDPALHDRETKRIEQSHLPAVIAAASKSLGIQEAAPVVTPNRHKNRGNTMKTTNLV